MSVAAVATYPTGSSMSVRPISVEFTMKLDPITSEGSLQYTVKNYLFTGSTNTGSPVGIGAGNIFAGTVDVAARKFGVAFNDPISGADLSNVTFAGVKLILSKMFETLYGELPTSS
jgi:hypothetical protein